MQFSPSVLWAVCKRTLRTILISSYSFHHTKEPPPPAANSYPYQSNKLMKTSRCFSHRRAYFQPAAPGGGAAHAPTTHGLLQPCVQAASITASPQLRNSSPTALPVKLNATAHQLLLSNTSTYDVQCSVQPHAEGSKHTQLLIAVQPC